MIKARMYSIITLLFVMYATVLAQPKVNPDPWHYSIQKKIVTGKAAVVTAHPLASKAGVLMLQKGGNAFDAFIASQWMLGVVYPWAGTMGGGGFMMARTSKGKLISLDFRETAPAAATRDMFIGADGKGDTHRSQNGHIACGVPALVAGLYEAHRYAKLPMAMLMQPAIDVAEKGFIITKKEADRLNTKSGDFIANNLVTPLFVKTGGWKAGDTLIQKDLANTLKRIQKDGKKEFYEGKTAHLITSEMKKAGGLITLDDLKRYRIAYREPLVFNYKQYKVVAMGPPSSGGIILNQVMKMIEKRNIGKMGFHTPASVHLLAEAERRSFADRAEYMGDPDFIKVPLKTLTSENYLSGRMKDFNPQQATPSGEVKAGVIKKEGTETTHVSIIDKEGNAISVTTTLNAGYGSGVVIDGTGIIMSNSMDDFSIQPGVANMYGAIGGNANAISPNKRMLSSMSPTIVLQNNRPFLILGSPGGTTIPTSVIQTILNVTEFGLTTEEAVNKPRFHHQWLPDRIDVEPDFSQSLREQLKSMGHTINNREGLGRVELIKITYSGNKRRIEAIGDIRGDDAAEGY